MLAPSLKKVGVGYDKSCSKLAIQARLGYIIIAFATLLILPWSRVQHKMSGKETYHSRVAKIQSTILIHHFKCTKFNNKTVVIII